jgi:hypothetical protein
MRIIFFILLLFSCNVWSCQTTTIAFKGLDGYFDNNAFQEYVKKKNSCSKIFEWHQINQVVRYIEQSDVSYQMYGYSKGAESVMKVMNQVNRFPTYIITIGAWKDVDLDFTKWNIPFHNYFDSSGIGQKSPGVFFKSVPHYKMQEHINKIIF